VVALYRHRTTSVELWFWVGGEARLPTRRSYQMQASTHATVAIVYWILCYHTAIQPYYHTAILSYYHTTILPYYHTTILPYYHTTILPCYHTTKLLNYHTTYYILTTLHNSILPTTILPTTTSTTTWPSPHCLSQTSSNDMSVPTARAPSANPPTPSVRWSARSRRRRSQAIAAHIDSSVQ
jgi:hypothetical protein